MRDGQQVDRHMEVYTPEIVDEREGIKSWIDEDKRKKEGTGNEYLEYLNNLAKGKITVNMSTNQGDNPYDMDPVIAKQDTAGIVGYETLTDTQALVGGSIKKVSRKNFSLVNKQD